MVTNLEPPSQVIAPFVDHNSKQRIQFVESTKHAATLMPKFLDMSKMERCLSGTSDYKYRCSLRLRPNPCILI